MVFTLVGMLGCKKSDVTQDQTGTYRLIRPESRDAQGLISIEIWAKDGVPTNRFVYARRIMADGGSVFTRMLP